MSFVILLFLALCLNNCAAKGKARSTPIAGVSAADDPHGAVRALALLWEARKSAEAFGRLRGVVGEERFSANAAILLQKPSSFYLELSGPFGRSALKFATDGKSIQLLFLKRNRYFSGSARPEQFENLLGIRLQPEELVALFLGEGIPFHEYALQEAVSNSANGTVRARFASERLAREAVLIVDPLVPRILEGAVYAPGGAAAPLNTFRFRYKKKASLPKTIELVASDGQYRIVLKYRYLGMTTPIKGKKFRVRIPAKARRIGTEEIRESLPLIFGGLEE